MITVRSVRRDVSDGVEWCADMSYLLLYLGAMAYVVGRGMLPRRPSFGW